MLLPDYATSDALLPGKRPEHHHETMVHDPGLDTSAQSSALSKNFGVETKSHLEQDGNEPMDQDTTDNEPSAISAVPENTNIQKTIGFRRKGKLLSLAPITVRKRRARTRMKTPRRKSNPFFDYPNYEWKGEEDTPALIEYIENRFNVTIHSKGPLSFTRKYESMQNLDISSMNLDSPSTPGSKQFQFVYELWSPRDGKMVHSLNTRFQSPATTPITPQNGLGFLDTLLFPTEVEGQHGFICTYKYPLSGEVCLEFVNIGQARYRHVAIHAQDEEELVVSGVMAMEDALAFTKLPKMTVICSFEGCGFEKKAWIINDAKNRHEMEFHPEEVRVRKRKCTNTRVVVTEIN